MNLFMHQLTFKCESLAKMGDFRDFYQKYVYLYLCMKNVKTFKIFNYFLMKKGV